MSGVELLLRLLEEHHKNRLLFKSSYSDDYTDYIYVDKLSQRIKPGYIRSTSNCFGKT
ncbi:hypothetical protein [Paenibacillus xylanivorans]|uniref:hypothetical protein n=1 Tax=Paenibacillus xylanivorans TaxID=1705561 RepID=UPI000B0F7201|nr:hypothetical protein [Paenibacillus xylanivorans]